MTDLYLGERIRQMSWPGLLIWAGIILTLTAPLIKGWRIYRSATSLQAHITTLQTEVDGGLSKLDTNVLEIEILAIRREAQLLHAELEPLLPITPYLTWVPRVGDLMPVTPELLSLMDNGTFIAADLGVEMLPAISVLQDDSTEMIEKVPELLGVIDEADASLERTSLIWPEIERDLQKILDTPAARDALPWQVRQLLPTIEPLLPLAPKGLEAVRVLPEIGALDTRRSYLIVGQNSDELRPTGGFLSMTMAVGIENGMLRGNRITDANVVDNYFDKPYGDPPAAMREFMGIDLWLFRDSNYWPDFPTSGRKMMEFYTYGTDIDLDGIAAFDIRFISRLIGAIGPIPVPNSDISLTGENTLEILEQAWSDGLEIGGVDRKDFLGNIAAGLIQHVQSDQFSPDIAALAIILDESFNDKSLQVYIDADEEKLAFAKMGVNGQISYGQDEDLLLFTESSVGINKSNRLLEREMRYTIDLSTDGSATSQLEVTWAHGGLPTDGCPLSDFSYRAGAQYAEMIQACNWNHVRLYAPEGSQLISSTQAGIPAAEMLTDTKWAGNTRQLQNDLANFTVLENLVLVRSGNTESFKVSYLQENVIIPLDSGHNFYRLNLIRQAGVYPYPETEIVVTLPEGQKFISASQQPDQVNSSTIIFKTVLNADQQIDVVFSRD
ncbi:MAG: DUF4012 domain-containing protein [Chloroflexota bacterium]